MVMDPRVFQEDVRARLDDVRARIPEWQSGLPRRPGFSSQGRVAQVLGTLIEAHMPPVQIGELCNLFNPEQPEKTMLAEVVGFTDKASILSALSPLEGVSTRTVIEPLRRSHSIEVGDHLFGCVLDGFGRWMFQAPAARDNVSTWRAMSPVIRDAPAATSRPRISTPLATGVRAIDGLLTMGTGQRIGVFAGPGCGKTTLMAAIARGCQAEAIVFGLIGERGRELNEFLDHELDEELIRKTVVVCATSDRTSMERSRAAFTATAIAEGFRDRGMKVLLLVDSLTRFARAQREIGLAAGEPPARGGFTPSVYTMLPRLIERAGSTPQGSITAMYTVLVDGESASDPIGDEAKSLLDGHILLTRKLAEQGHYPAIDVLASISRVMSNVTSREHRKAASQFRELMARYQEMELLIRLGEYKSGADPVADRAMELRPEQLSFLRQDTSGSSDFQETLDTLMEMAR
ncbi:MULTISPECIES: FliI/YscN family ATPase [unclassified Herbaspirillum]|uniref:FliI/YscN family ATPase n=1 Tax=unclassified Herbaspirillum TaxID=2624150 RepID=UPI00116A8CDB|nr:MULTISPECIES: FliI/YscN family ATPase [unclassified Herbaspirillum]MBB5391355.1 type III secretion protein N (ATPase) [Herbaspirillum sp. SJZ102]TQK12958.1 type III secretion protein N (ATPase) [Herbaspirillum sp. SJZ130]TQK14962.1 type III secretion protein N (ATPase) [Herbaspirillum sp. SJZ106]